MESIHAVMIILILAGIIVSGIIIGLAVIEETDESIPTPIENQTKPVVNDTLTCGEGTYEHNGTCVADPIPICEQGEMLNTTTLFCERVPPVVDNQTTIPPVINDTVPTPKPTPVDNKTRTIAALGDVDCDELVDPIKNSNPTLILILGDLCYDKNLTSFLSAWGTLGNLIKCTIGNHEAEENAASSTVIQQALDYCKNDQYVKHGKTIIFLVNTNGDLNKQLLGVKNLLGNQTFIGEFKNVVLATHKPCENLPGAHHPVESKVKAFCQAFNDAVPAGMQEIYLSGHDHIIAKGVNAEGDLYFISGAGGRSHYECGTVTGIWQFCNDKDYGWLELKIAPDGKFTDKFFNIRGEEIDN